jgi:hypothetical protein
VKTKKEAHKNDLRRLIAPERVKVILRRIRQGAFGATAAEIGSSVILHGEIQSALQNHTEATTARKRGRAKA